jgi:hypothetical protein
MPSILRRIVRRLISRQEVAPGWKRKANVLETAIDFAIANNIAGDYLEFGVFQGRSFTHAYNYFHSRFRRYAGDRDGEFTEYRRQVERMRFIAFDSFEGLPAVAQENLPLHWRGPAAMKCPKDQFSDNIAKAGVKLSDVRMVEGFYDRSLTEACKSSLQVTTGAIFHVDCDLYESTVQVLDFITSLIQDGSVIVFDDWFYYRGHPERGEQGAFRQWLRKNPKLVASELCALCPAAAFIINLP